MRKFFILVSLMLATNFITACGSSDNETVSPQSSISESGNTPNSDSTNESAVSAAEDEKSTSESDIGNGEIDIDLTQLSSSMVYAQVYDMVNNGDDYLGKTVKAKGAFAYYQDEQTGNEYFAVLISDATACCAQGIEFVLDGDHTYPDDYPELGTKVTVIGEFNYYKEDYSTYCQLLHAEMEVDNSLSWN